jgi:xanthine dehydrogenase accessory factor
MKHRVRLEAAEAVRDGTPRLVAYFLGDPTAGDPRVCAGETEIYLEPFMPKPTLYVVGAGHVGRAVSDLAQWLGFRTVVWDDRSEVIDDAEHADTTLTGPITAALEAEPITPDTSVVVVTRNVKLDLEILPPLLQTSARYIGLMGSTRRWDTTRQALVDQGIAPTELDRIRAPIGVEIQAETPEEIAVSILAQVVANRRGG